MECSICGSKVKENDVICNICGSPINKPINNNVVNNDIGINNQNNNMNNNMINNMNTSYVVPNNNYNNNCYNFICPHCGIRIPENQLYRYIPRPIMNMQPQFPTSNPNNQFNNMFIGTNDSNNGGF